MSDTIKAIADALDAEFVVQHRAGGTHAGKAYVADFLARELKRKAIMVDAWAYYTNGGKSIRVTTDKEYADNHADGFKWNNPRVRKVRMIITE